MNKRDKEILNDLKRFRVMGRDDIAKLHFSNSKNPEKNCNSVLKRLRRDGYIEANTSHLPYLYFPAENHIKKDSSKINHFLEILHFYMEIRKYSPVKQFIVEPKYGKEFMEPDVFMIWNKAPFFVEIQRCIYSDKVMANKMSRYTDYFYSEHWKQEEWQPTNKQYFPNLWLITDKRYNLDVPFKVTQTQDVKELIQMLKLRMNGYENIG
jgi:hypothetical protein